MLHPIKNARFGIATLVLAGLCCGFIAAAKRSKAAPDARMQDENTVLINLQQLAAVVENPIQVTGMSINGKQYEFGSPFKAAEDWLKDFSVTVKNNSGRTIIGVGLNLEWVARDLNKEHYIPMTPLYAGELVIDGASIQTKGLPLRPGESAELSVEPQWYESHMKHKAGKSHVQHKQIPEDVGRKAKLRYEYVGFDSDNIWLNGNYVHRDPSNPQRWVPDQEQKKRIGQYLRSQPKMMYASFRPRNMLAECIRYKDSQPVNCTTLDGCPAGQGCHVVKDTARDLESGETVGWKLISYSIECKKWVGGVLVACGCCKNTPLMCYEIFCLCQPA